MRSKIVQTSSKLQFTQSRNIRSSCPLFKNYSINMILLTVQPQAIECFYGIHSYRLFQTFRQIIPFNQVVNQISPLTIVEIIKAILAALDLGNNISNKLMLAIENSSAKLDRIMQKHKPNAKVHKFACFEYVKKLMADSNPISALIPVGKNGQFDIYFFLSKLLETHSL